MIWILQGRKAGNRYVIRCKRSVIRSTCTRMNEWMNDYTLPEFSVWNHHFQIMILVSQTLITKLSLAVRMWKDQRGNSNQGADRTKYLIAALDDHLRGFHFSELVDPKIFLRLTKYTWPPCFAGQLRNKNHDLIWYGRKKYKKHWLKKGGDINDMYGSKWKSLVSL